MTTELEQITRHFGEGLVSLVPSFWGKPVMAAILRSYLRRVQELEDDIFEVLGAFDVRTCDATRLAVLGKIVGQSNLGWDTETYRAVVRAKIAANRSHGREDDLVSVIRLAAGVTTPTEITQTGNATLTITLGETITDAAATALTFLLPKTRAAGVQLHLFRPTDDDALLWADTTDPGSGTDFADTTIPSSGASAYDVRIL